MSAVLAPPQYRCANERRREVVRAAGTLNGIDWLEVSDDQLSLVVHFLQPLPGTGAGAVPANPPLTRTNVEIPGGTRIRGINVVAVSVAADVLTVGVDRAGDFSPYELRLVDPVTDAAPAGFDPRLSGVVFSFKSGCPSDLDCDAAEVCPPEVLDEPALDYLAKDYDSFRQLMLDRLATTLPGWTERNPADLTVALVELLAYVADHLSYEQDAIATEAYLGTARRRVSVRRHARLLDYRMHQGCSARVFVHFTVSAGLTIPVGTGVRAGPGASAMTFETLHPVAARPVHNELAFHTWSDEACCLPRGALRATVVDPGSASLGAGDFVVLEETRDPSTGGDPDPDHRQVVRLTGVTADTDPLDATPLLELTWDADDALAFPLCITSEQGVTACLRANVALVDHGATRHETVVYVDGIPTTLPLSALPIAFTVAYDATQPASAMLLLDPSAAVAAISLDDGDEVWLPQFDLLGAAPHSPSFVVEVDEDGTTALRFGDDIAGQRPPDATEFAVTSRVGGGAAGNVAAEAIDRLASNLDGVDGVRNPLPAEGGADPEPSDLVRQLAPQAFRRQERAVTEADYGTIADRFAGLQQSAATMRWTGSWYTAFVTVDRTGGGAPEDDDLGDRLRAFLDTYRMAGVDVEISAPVPAPIDLALDVCVRQDSLASDVESGVLEALAAGVRSDGRRGFFDPDNFTLGQPVYLSQIYAAALAVPGVAWVQATTFRRFGRSDAGELAAGVLRVQRLEIAQLASDPSFPERGRLTLTMRGGR